MTERLLFNKYANDVIIICTNGVVAHLGERIAGSDEVESSSLFGSTIRRKQDGKGPVFFINTGSAAANIQVHKSSSGKL